MNVYIPVKLYTGKGVLKAHPEELLSFGKRAFLITGKHGAKGSGALDDLLEIFEKNTVSYDIYDEIKENPTVSSCIEAGRKAYDFQADVIIGIGGGSVMDAAKVIALFAKDPSLDEEKLYAKDWKKERLPLILIGTTAGTGSEVTKVSVLTDKNGRKKSIHDDLFYADLSFGDPSYTASMSSHTARSTAIDALAHLLESYFSNKADVFSRSCSLEGIRILLPKLKKMAEGVSLSEEDRTVVYEASLLGGYAIASTGTVFPHNVGYYFTETYHIPHGFACALFMEDLLEYEKKNDPAYTEEFYSLTFSKEEDYKDICEKLLPKYDISLNDETLQKILPRWEDNGSVKNTRGHMTVQDVEEILRRRFQ